MTEIHLNLNNIFDAPTLISLFPASEQYEFTADKIFRKKDCLPCSCGNMMVHNGYDYVRKRKFGKAKIGKQLCKKCGNQYHEDKKYWKCLLTKWQETITSMIMTLRNSHISWDIVSKILGFIIPCSKGKSMYMFNNHIEQFEYPQDNFLIVNYDEQHPKRGRTQKFRLTLLNYKTRVPIADELFDSKDDKTIEAFLRKHLDVEKEIIIITDCDRRYPAIFKRIWGKKAIHQKCLLHLNKLVVKDFGKNISLQNLYNLYLILDIFYNRRKELKFIERILKKFAKKKFVSNEEKRLWVKEQKTKFYDMLKDLENERRRNRENLPQRPLLEAEQNLKRLLAQSGFFPKKARERLNMIEKNWKALTAFYLVEGCPATNNAIENYYSTSLKTHRKKQMRTDRGLLNHMKLSALKRISDFSQPKNTLIEIYGWVRLISV